MEHTWQRHMRADRKEKKAGHKSDESDGPCEETVSIFARLIILHFMLLLLK